MADKKSYSQVLKTSSIMGGAASITMIIQMVRVKFAAVFLGSLGVGVVSNMLVVQNLITTVAGLGVNTSAVKSIAEATGKKGQVELSKTVLSVKRASLLLGLLGVGLTLALSGLLSSLLFGDDTYANDIALLSAAVFFMVLANGQVAAIQGMRKIGELAKIQIVSGLLGTIIIVALYIYMGIQGIAPGLVAASFIRFAVAFFSVRNINIPLVATSWKESLSLSGNMVRLGIAFMWTVLLSTAVLFTTNALISNQISLDAVGLFSAAFALSGMFVNFVLNAMQADYYPRLVSAASDKELMNRMVNEQTEIGLLLVVPGIILTLALAHWAIIIFYSSEFLPAIDLLQWFILGCLVRVVQWPMGFIQVALGKARLYAGLQTLFSVVHLLFVWVGLNVFGLVGVAIAFALIYVFSASLIMYVSYRLTGLKWSSGVINLSIRCFLAVMLVFIAVKFLTLQVSMVTSIVFFILTSLFCIRRLTVLLGPHHRFTKIVKRHLKAIAIK